MIRIELSKCTGCRSCEVACAFYHSGAVNNRASRIKVTSIYETGVDGPVACVQCKERYCMACPKKAIKLGKLGQIVVSPSLCNACRKCERNCPIGAIEVFNELTYVCDLCGGTPKCVEACTEGAIVYENQPAIQPVSLAQLRKQTARLNAAEKRCFYTTARGEQMRRKWSTKDA